VQCGTPREYRRADHAVATADDGERAEASLVNIVQRAPKNFR